MTLPARRQSRFTLPDLMSDWFENFPTPFAGRALAEHVVRVEEYEQDGRFVIKAEIPGVDPEEGLDVTVQDGMLTIKAERTEEEHAKHRSEFRYGSFTRTVALPAEVREDDVRAEYKNGILMVSLGMREEKEAVKHVQIEHKE